MGTRADFYISRDGGITSSDWIGSIAYDGYPDGIPSKILSATTEDDFKLACLSEINGREDGTFASMGWPWPWDDSCTTDYAYVFCIDCGVVVAYNWGVPMLDMHFVGDDDDANIDVDHQVKFPLMSTLRAAKAGNKRSGIMLIQTGGNGAGERMNDRVPIHNETRTVDWGWTCPWCDHDHRVVRTCERSSAYEKVCHMCNGRVLLCVSTTVSFNATPYSPCAQVEKED